MDIQTASQVGGRAGEAESTVHVATASELRQAGNEPEQRPLLHLSAPYFNPAQWVVTVLLSRYCHASLLPGGIPLSALKTREFQHRWITVDSDFLAGHPSEVGTMTHARNRRAEYTAALFQSLRSRPHRRAPMSLSVYTWFFRVYRYYEAMKQLGSLRFCNMHREVRFDPWYMVNTRSMLPICFRFGNGKYFKDFMEVAEFERGNVRFPES